MGIQRWTKEQWEHIRGDAKWSFVQWAFVGLWSLSGHWTLPMIVVPAGLLAYFKSAIDQWDQSFVIVKILVIASLALLLMGLLACAIALYRYWTRQSDVSKISLPIYTDLSFSYGLVHRDSLPSATESQVVFVTNKKVDTENTISNLTARVQFVHADGSRFTVTEATWFLEKKVDERTETMYKSSVDLMGAETARFIVCSRNSIDGSLYSGKKEHPVGICGTGKWIVKFILLSDRGVELEGESKILVLPSKEFKWEPIS